MIKNIIRTRIVIVPFLFLIFNNYSIYAQGLIFDTLQVLHTPENTVHESVFRGELYQNDTNTLVVDSVVAINNTLETFSLSCIVFPGPPSCIPGSGKLCDPIPVQYPWYLEYGSFERKILLRNINVLRDSTLRMDLDDFTASGETDIENLRIDLIFYTNRFIDTLRIYFSTTLLRARALPGRSAQIRKSGIGHSFMLNGRRFKMKQTVAGGVVIHGSLKTGNRLQVQGLEVHKLGE